MSLLRMYFFPCFTDWKGSFTGFTHKVYFTYYSLENIYTMFVWSVSLKQLSKQPWWCDQGYFSYQGSNEMMLLVAFWEMSNVMCVELDTHKAHTKKKNQNISFAWFWPSNDRSDGGGYVLQATLEVCRSRRCQKHINSALKLGISLYNF